MIYKTLLVDGNNLMKIGFHGAKSYYNKDGHIGAVWYFLNTIRRFIDENYVNKVLVFWDGENSSLNRKMIYEGYKENRKGPTQTDEYESFILQKHRIKQYLEEVFVRQVEVPNNEADDLIGYYCSISEDEEKIILSSDKDLTQLISDKTIIYAPITKSIYKKGDYISFNQTKIPHYNVLEYKILVGDTSDNIQGIYKLGNKTLLKYFPEIGDKDIDIDYILEKTKTLVENGDKSKTLYNILNGVTSTKEWGDEYYNVVKLIVDLNNPMITDEGVEVVKSYYQDAMDPEGRDYKNMIRLMEEDGLFQFLPRKDNGWVDFIRPFLKLTRKEKNMFKTKNR